MIHRNDWLNVCLEGELIFLWFQENDEQLPHVYSSGYVLCMYGFVVHLNCLSCFSIRMVICDRNLFWISVYGVVWGEHYLLSFMLCHKGVFIIDS